MTALSPLSGGWAVWVARSRERSRTWPRCEASCSTRGWLLRELG